MKKIISLNLLVLLLFLTSCQKKTEINIIIPSGGPTYAFLQMMEKNQVIDSKKVSYESVSGVDLLISAITSKSHQIVVAPTNVGAQLYQKDSDYQIAGIVSFGNLYIVSKEPIDDLSGKTILAFGKNSTPDIILQKILKEKQLLDKVTIEYVVDVNSAREAFVSNKYQVVLLAEPVLSLTTQSFPVNIVIDLQKAYKEITNSDYYPQASIFIEKNFANNNRNFVKAFLRDLQLSINFVNKEKETAADYYLKNEALIPRLPKNVIISSIPQSNVAFLDVKTGKTLLNDYFRLLFEFNPNTIGQIPDDNFYLEVSE